MGLENANSGLNIQGETWKQTLPHTEKEAPEPPRAPETGVLLCSARAAALGAVLASRRVPSAGVLKMEHLHPFPEVGNLGVHPRPAFPSNEAQFHSRVPTAGRVLLIPWLQSFWVLQC